MYAAGYARNPCAPPLCCLVHVYCDQVFVRILLVIDIGMRLFREMALHMVKCSTASTAALKMHFLSCGREQSEIHVWAYRYNLAIVMCHPGPMRYFRPNPHCSANSYR